MNANIEALVNKISEITGCHNPISASLIRKALTEQAETYNASIELLTYGKSWAEQEVAELKGNIHEQAETHAIELAKANERIRQLEYDKKIYLARAEASEADYARVVGRNRQLEAERVPDGCVPVPAEMIERFPEINQHNYNHDDVCELNAWGVELVLAAAPAQESSNG